MNEYREFISTFRELELSDVYFLLHENMTPIFTKYVRMVRDLKFGDGTYQTYYYDLKKIITSFFHYYDEKIDKTIKDVDRYTHIITKGTVVDLCDKTIEKYQKKQMNFEFEFLPVKTEEEKDCFERIKKKMVIYVQKLNDVSAAVQKLDKQFKVDAFARKFLPASIKGDYEKFKYTHQFLARMLAARVTDIDTSISEINIRVCHTFQKYQSQCEVAINSLLHQLYNVNKEFMRLHRKHRRSTIDHEEVNKSIRLIRQKIDEYCPKDTPMRRLQEEVQYWTSKSEELDFIATALAIVKRDLDYLVNLERRLKQLDNNCSCCSETLEELNEDEILPISVIRKKQNDLNSQYDEYAKCLFTFFCARGKNLIYYRDHIGQYYIDEYGHKIYSFEHGLELCHMHKDGSFEELQEAEQRYFNEYGTYIFEEAIEHASTATLSTTSSSSLDSFFLDSSDDVLAVQKSIMSKSKARIDKKEHFGINIKNKLNVETVRYLWDVFGAILPVALSDVFAAKSKNPINCLAHKLLKHRHASSLNELKTKKEEAKIYRDQRYKKAQLEAQAEATGWRSKLPKRHKLEEVFENDIQNVFISVACHQDFVIGSHFTC